MQPQKIGLAQVSKVLEFEENPMPMTFMMPSVTAEDLGVLAGWHVGEALGPTPETSMLDLGWHTYVIEAAGKVLLVDTGLGNSKSRSDPIAFCDHLDTDYLARLAAIGITPDDVDAVVCTHLHFDHVGWNTVWDGGSWRPTFPRATYHLPAADVIHFGAEAADPVTAPSFVDSVQPVIDAGQARLVGDGDVVLDEGGVLVRLESAAGHSPGSVLVWLESGGARAVFTGDVMHHPVQLVRPEIRLAVEEHPDASTATRLRLLDQITDRDILAFPAHFRGTSGGRVVTNPHGPGRRWKPVR